MKVFGKPGRLVELRKNDVLVPEYQREVDWPRVRKCARQFNWHLFGVPFISHRISPNVTKQGVVEEPGYYIVDGRNRLEMARLVPTIDMIPALTFEFDGPQHEAEIFVELQKYRKPLVTRDVHAAELIAGGEFGHIARAAEDFVEGLECDTVPLASIRKLVAHKPDAFSRVASLVRPMVGTQPLAKDFIEALVYLEDALMQVDGESLATTYRERMMNIGYDRLVASMIAYQAQNAEGRLAKIASPRMKAEALRWAIANEPTLEPVYHDGEAIGARVGITAADVAAD